MIERLVENWLANAGERGYEVAFAQLLAAEDYRVIQGPVHHPFEHGKDIFAFAPNGQLHAFQLKGPDLTDLESFEKIQGQLMALSGTAVTHPAVTPARRPDRVFLVSNAVLTPPVRDRIEKFNAGNVQNGWAPVEPVERDQLWKRFVAAHGAYLPQSLPDIRVLLELYYSDPESLFPVRSFAEYLGALLPLPPASMSIPECRRAIASATILTAYASASWTTAANHVAVAQAWLVVCTCILRFADARALKKKHWLGSYELALEAARVSLASMAKEASDAPDLVVPSLTDGAVYHARASLVCGLLSAYFLSERTLGNLDEEISDRIRKVLTREAGRAKLTGEADAPAMLLTGAALEQLGEIAVGEAQGLSLVYTIARVNQRKSPVALADPYHEAEQILLQQMGLDSDLDGEQFDGRSYMLHVGVEWVTRRLWRQHLGAVWAPITRIQFVEFQPSSPTAYLAPKDSEGELVMWQPEQPQSWAALLQRARTLDRTRLPAVLWERREMLPYLPLLFPYRFTATLAAAIDTIATDPHA